MVLFLGCRTHKNAVKEVYIHDTIRKTEIRVDSVDRWRTHYEYLQGDTYYIRDTFWLTRYKVQHKTDTVVQKVMDTQFETVTEEKKVYVWWTGLVVFLALAGTVVGWKIWKRSKS